MCICCSVPLLKNLPTNKIAKIADVLEMVSKRRSAVVFIHCPHIYYDITVTIGSRFKLE